MNAPAHNAAVSPVKQALAEIRALRARLAEAESSRREPIAIVGMGMRFPGGVHDAEGFAELLWSARDAVTEIPPQRWLVDALYAEDPDQPGKMTTRHGAFLANVDQFDAEFFGISPREAASMDPQQRLILEVGWEALEDSGRSPMGLGGARVGVYLGIANNDYGRALFARPELIDAYFSTGNAYSVAAGRLSYHLGLQGPSLAIDTACSSSLVAVHLASQALRLGECDLALAGGVNLILTPEMNINFSKARMMAADGRCKTFDAAADGYVRGEGCALVVLRRLSDALADGDRVFAVIKGSAINQDGRSGGLTAPNGPAQEAVIRAALANAGVEASAVGYVETHGTGDAARGSDRGGSARRGLQGPTRRTPADRLGEDECRTSGGRRRHGRRDQGRPEPAAPSDCAEPSLPSRKSADRLGRAEPRRPGAGASLDPDRGATHRRRQRLRLQWHERARLDRRGAPLARAARRRHGAAVAHPRAFRPRERSAS